ncbi:sugar phosphate isomerase/epimerase [Mycetocola sp. CAN_C7]|uniref:sugar phosphate isomerase/epimerase family protein n=1 Tax=Mycetocola sp. CAN_C7 TaxID=2787724 RepID=UPI0018CB04E0
MIRIGMSTSSVYPLGTERAFAFAEKTGYDGVEVMVTNDAVTQDADALLALSTAYGMPILSIHAPVLLLTHFVWGTDPLVKLRKSAELASDVGADTVVVHPPFRWQKGYADEFLDRVRSLAESTGIHIAVENMFPWQIRGRTMKAYSPGWDTTTLDCDDVTLDFSHASLAGQDAFDLAIRLGSRLRHLHLCDGSGSSDDGRVFDEHLLPGHGTQPVARVLRHLAEQAWNGSVVAEVNLRKARSDVERHLALEETLHFARTHLGHARPGNDHTRELPSPLHRQASASSALSPLSRPS